jgi:hypothetical protein
LEAGYNLEITWEHEFRSQYYDNFKKSKSYHMGLHDAYFGGRTEVFRHFYKCNDDEEIRSYDINSVYPAIMLGKLDLYGELHEFPLPMGEPVECMMTVDEL